MDPRDAERQEIEAELKRISKLSKDKAIAELRDRLEEIRVQRVQNKLLKKELDEKNAEIANEREETARWKARAFSSARTYIFLFFSLLIASPLRDRRTTNWCSCRAQNRCKENGGISQITRKISERKEKESIPSQKPNKNDRGRDRFRR